MISHLVGQVLVQDSLTRRCRSRIEDGIATPSLVPTKHEVRASTWMGSNAINVSTGAIRYAVLDGRKVRVAVFSSLCTLNQKKAFGEAEAVFFLNDRSIKSNFRRTKQIPADTVSLFGVGVSFNRSPFRLVRLVVLMSL